MPPLNTPAELAAVRSMLRAALKKLHAGRGIYAEASMLAGWLNANAP